MSRWTLSVEERFWNKVDKTGYASLEEATAAANSKRLELFTHSDMDIEAVK